jgi:hypothetical protein
MVAIPQTLEEPEEEEGGRNGGASEKDGEGEAVEREKKKQKDSYLLKFELVRFEMWSNCSGGDSREYVGRGYLYDYDGTRVLRFIFRSILA